MFEMKFTIARIIQNFEVKIKNIDEELKLHLETVLKSKNGIKLSFCKIKL
jgi:hypothetical protein